MENASEQEETVQISSEFRSGLEGIEDHSLAPIFR
jgi:tRNA (Thr-GGU) A37 N-methylase